MKTKLQACILVFTLTSFFTFAEEIKFICPKMANTFTSLEVEGNDTLVVEARWTPSTGYGWHSQNNFIPKQVDDPAPIASKEKGEAWLGGDSTLIYNISARDIAEHLKREKTTFTFILQAPGSTKAVRSCKVEVRRNK